MVQFYDLDGDRKADVYGRGSGGIWCALSDGGSFNTANTATLWTTEFSNAKIGMCPPHTSAPSGSSRRTDSLPSHNKHPLLLCMVVGLPSSDVSSPTEPHSVGLLVAPLCSAITTVGT